VLQSNMALLMLKDDSKTAQLIDTKVI
jgi:hypothetical protein